MVDVDSGEHVGVAPSVPLVQFTPHGEQEFVQSVRRHRGQLVQATYVALLDGAVPLDVVARYRAPSPPHDFVASASIWTRSELWWRRRPSFCDSSATAGLPSAAEACVDGGVVYREPPTGWLVIS